MRIYELYLNSRERRKFKELCLERMKEEGLSIKDVSEKVNYSYKTVAKFLSRNCDGYLNRFLAARLFELLDIKYNSWKE